MKKHVHCELIKAYADGAMVQRKDRRRDAWVDMTYPCFQPSQAYRIKPEEDEGYAATLAQHARELQESLDRINALQERMNSQE